MKHLLEVDHISVSFATPRGPVEAVHGVSFYLDEGEMVGIVGESGCGKSVTSQTVMKLLPPSVSKLTSGRIIWDGFNIENFSEREMNTLRGKEMAMVFQDPMTSLNPVLTVGEQIEEGLRLHLHLSKKEAAEEAVRLLQS
ncbi:MAG: ABC transporter ATP-binding protein, partial [Megasphaera micronuciformis]|nr:ABC transporter ATP-binding protein [Megasphaera micronuciformis]